MTVIRDRNIEKIRNKKKEYLHYWGEGIFCSLYRLISEPAGFMSLPKYDSKFNEDIYLHIFKCRSFTR